MVDDAQSLIKHREVRFVALNPDPKQAHTATLLLDEVDGIVQARPISPHILHVTYDITVITLAMIEASLVEVGFHLENTLMSKLKRALYYYTEDTQRANLGLEKPSSDSTHIFIDRYQRARHGCRDQRPHHWRKYS